MSAQFQPMLELTRRGMVESVHFGAAAVVEATGHLLAWYGDPQAAAFLRSSAKPFQALPFIERGGHQTFGLTSREIALMCASHSGTDKHVEVVKGMQVKIGISESDLQCGAHPIHYQPVVEAMRARGEVPSPNRNNCSGKHTGMLAHAKMRGLSLADYLDPNHPVQQSILAALAEICDLPPEQVVIAIDGCCAPTFAVPLRNAALAYAHLCDPRNLSAEHTAACHTITSAMTAHPDMVAGPERFDTRLMQVTGGRILSKGGAEGYQGLGIMPGVLGPDSPGIGIALKILDGDLSTPSADGRKMVHRAGPAVALEILRQLGAISLSELEALAEFGPRRTLTNWRKLVVGESRPIFMLEK